jgi:arylsulfatase A-like enzyme
MALNNDLAPTFASWAGITPPSFVDGRSLTPLLSVSPHASWRTAFLVEHRRSAEEYDYVRRIPNYSAVRTSRYNYVEYETGEKELYDLNADPTELTSLHASASHQALISDLKARLDALKICAGADTSATSCRRAEGG